MTPKIPRLAVPAAPSSAMPASTSADLLALLEGEAPTGVMLLSDLTPHPNPSRPLAARHVINMALSLDAVGLIHPLAVDRTGTVIAGAHRFAALRLLASSDRAATLLALCPAMTKADAESLPPAAEALPSPKPDLVDRVPIRRLPFSLADSPDEAWQVEVAENERRRDYSTSEIKAIASKLKERGYHLTRGAPSGRARGLPVLAALIGKSERHIRRILAQPDGNRPDGLNLHEKDRRSAAAALGRYRDRWAGSLTEAQARTLRRAAEVLDEVAR